MKGGKDCHGPFFLLDDASVKISPEGFKDPFAYLDLEQTTSQANEYVSYFTGRGSSAYFNVSEKTFFCVWQLS